MVPTHLSKNNISKLARTVAGRLADSVETSYILKDIEEKKKLLYILNCAQIEYWYKIGEVWIIGDHRGMLAGHYKNDEHMLQLMGITLKANLTAYRLANKHDRRQLIRNVKNISGTTDVKWRDQICGGSNYYYIDLITISHLLKGSGAFRKLIDPILLRSSKMGIPILLDTHDESNVALYEYFGFELAAKHSSHNNREMVQYSMVKWPQDSAP